MIRNIPTILMLILLWCFLVVPCLEAQSESRQRLFSIIVNKQVGFIDQSGKVIIEPRFNGAHEFAEGRAVVAISTINKHKEGFIDESGKFIAEANFDKAQDFSDGLAAVGIGQFGLHENGDHKWGFIDRSGKMVIEPQFRETLGFTEGLAAVANMEGKWGYIDKIGQMVVPFQYEDASPFSEGLACVKTGGFYGYINKNGEVVIKPDFATARQFKDGLASVMMNDKKKKAYLSVGGWFPPDDAKVAFIDRTGKLSFQFEKNVKQASDFSEGLARISVEKNGGWYTAYIDKTGKFVIPPAQSDTRSDFSNGLALVFIKDKVNFIDKTGKIVIKTNYRYARGFVNGMAWVEDGGPVDEFGERKNAKYYYIDTDGKTIWRSN